MMLIDLSVLQLSAIKNMASFFGATPCHCNQLDGTMLHGVMSPCVLIQLPLATMANVPETLLISSRCTDWVNISGPLTTMRSVSHSCSCISSEHSLPLFTILVFWSRVKWTAREIYALRPYSWTVSCMARW